jgi:hypothetical protein
MIAAQNRFKQDQAPPGGQCSRFGGKRGGHMIAAQNRFKQDQAPLGGSAAALAANVGAI